MRWLTTACSLFIFSVLSTSWCWAQHDLLEAASVLDKEHSDDSAKQLNHAGVHVLTLRSPAFGSFYCGAGGGKIIVHEDGTRTSEGDVILMNSGVSIAPALFEVSCDPDIMIQLVSDGYFKLYAQDGYELKAKILSTDPAFPCVSPINARQGFVVTASVCLEIDAGQPISPGNYNGSFQLNWISE